MPRCCCWKRSNESLRDREEENSSSDSDAMEGNEVLATNRSPCSTFLVLEMRTIRDQSTSVTREEMEEEEEEECGPPPRCTISGWHDNEPSVSQLEKFLLQWSSYSSFDQSRTKDLVLTKVLITRPLIHRLLPFLLLRDEASSSRLLNDDDGAYKNKMDHHVASPGNTRINTPVLTFSNVTMEYHFNFFSDADVTMPGHDDDVCTPEDKHLFFSALARLRGALFIQSDSPVSLSGLLNLPETNHLEVQELVICQKTHLSAMEYVRLGVMIERSVHLTDLTLQLPFVGVPREFYDSFANAIQIKKLRISSTRYLDDVAYYREEILPSLIASDDGNGVVERLLRNPQNQLTRLDLSHMHLEDFHLISVGQLLPTSKVTIIDFSHNAVHCHGLLEFARLLPKMHSLSIIFQRGNPWKEAELEARNECGAALLHALIENPSITYMNDLEDLPQCHLLWHYLSLNSAGRKILRSLHPHGQEKQSTSIPDGLWPHILARAGKCDDMLESCTHHNPSNVVYFFVQNCPIIVSGSINRK